MGKVHDSKKTENTSPMYSVSQEITCGETRLDDKWRAVYIERCTYGSEESSRKPNERRH